MNFRAVGWAKARTRRFLLDNKFARAVPTREGRRVDTACESTPLPTLTKQFVMAPRCAALYAVPSTFD
jgi:hypothetical protein